MAKSFCLALLTFALLFDFLQASPLSSVFQYDDNDGDDLDDTDVIEVPSNYLEEAAAEEKSPKDIIDLSFYGLAIFGSPDVETTAKLVANYTPEESGVNPEELGSYLEGDILVPSDNADSGRGFYTKNGVTTQSSRWPGGIVPFEIRGNFGAQDLATIENAIEQYHRRTCIRFVPRTTERDYISIVSGNSGCWSSVGRVGGKQEVNLQSPGCLGKPGTAMHELMHALGFLHEQNRQERDNFVSIQYQNIQRHAVSNFEKASRTQAFGVPYDYGSVMHYSANAFSSNGRPTIVAVQPGGSSQMGQRNGFSAFDVQKLNKMYDCGLNPGNGGNGGGIAPGPVPAYPAPNPAYPAPLPAPAPAPAMGSGGLIGNFLGGLFSGLGLAEEQDTTTTAEAEAEATTTKINES